MCTTSMKVSDVEPKLKPPRPNWKQDRFHLIYSELPRGLALRICLEVESYVYDSVLDYGFPGRSKCNAFVIVE